MDWGATDEAVPKEGFVRIDISKSCAERSLFSNLKQPLGGIENDKTKVTHRMYQRDQELEEEFPGDRPQVAMSLMARNYCRAWCSPKRRGRVVRSVSSSGHVASPDDHDDLGDQFGACSWRLFMERTRKGKAHTGQ